MSLNWTAITERVFVTTLEPHRVNVGLVVGTNSAMLIDSGNSPEQGAALLASAQQLTGLKVSHAVLTHGHHDHVGGLPAFNGVTTIGHENADVKALTRTFSMALAIDLGEQRVELLHFGNAHTKGDSIIFVPGEKVIFMGDLLEEGTDPQVDEDTSLSNWPTVLDGVLGAATADTTFVPGHGKPVDRDFAFIQRAEISMLYGQTEMLIEQGVALADAAAATDWPFNTETLRTALPKAYAELAEKGVEPRRQLPITGI